jgi:hypothetical protein
VIERSGYAAAQAFATGADGTDADAPDAAIGRGSGMSWNAFISPGVNLNMADVGFAFK